MKILEAIRKCKFEEGEYLKRCTSYSYDKNVAKLIIDGKGKIKAYDFEDMPCDLDYNLNQFLDMEWEIKSKYLNLNEAFIEAKNGKKIARKDWDSIGDFIAYIPAINQYLAHFRGFDKIYTEEQVRNTFWEHNWYVASEREADNERIRD